MSRLRFAGALIVFLALPRGSTMAENFGAIACSPDSGADGYAVDCNSRGDAQRRALDECGGCQVVLWFKSACGALATGDGNAYGTGWANSQGEAEGIVLAQCSARAGNCGIQPWACTTR